MTLCFKQLLAFFLAAWAIQAAALAEDSLLDVRTARLPAPDVRLHLGPKSGSLHYDPRMLRAVQIALSRAHSRPTWRCWHFVKDALVQSQVIPSRPVTPWAKQAGEELCRKFGFTRLNVRTPLEAPPGAVIVYGGADAGHVELRTSFGFVSDFVSRTPYPRPLIGVFVKPA